jgi:hypothetical protein
LPLGSGAQGSHTGLGQAHLNLIFGGSGSQMEIFGQQNFLHGGQA